MTDYVHDADTVDYYVERYKDETPTELARLRRITEYAYKTLDQDYGEHPDDQAAYNGLQLEGSILTALDRIVADRRHAREAKNQPRA